MLNWPHDRVLPEGSPHLVGARGSGYAEEEGYGYG